MSSRDCASINVIASNIPELFTKMGNSLKMFEVDGKFTKQVRSVSIFNRRPTEEVYILSVEFVGEHNSETCSQCEDERLYPEKYTR